MPHFWTPISSSNRGCSHPRHSESESPAGNICVVLSGGNIDRKLFANILAD